MKKPINIPCIFVENYEEIDKAEKLGLEKPKEKLRVIWTSIIEIAHIQPNVDIDSTESPVTNSWICSGGRNLATPMDMLDILKLMKENNWIE